MEALAVKRGWEVTALAIAPPASEAVVAALEAKHGLKVPPQLRELLTKYAASVRFGWGIPSEMEPLERVPNSGGLRDAVWDLAHIDQYAIDNFLGWRKGLAEVDISEEPNTPEMWEHQLPFADLMNGDMLTIDVAAPEGPHPVRYFSHDLEGLHARAIAPDFLTFVTEYARLGCAGGTHDDWFDFVEKLDDGRQYLNAGTTKAQQWLAWLAKDPNAVDPDEPPKVIMAKTAADHALLEAAKANALEGVTTALDAGASIDCVEEGNWNDEFVTAVTHAIRNDSMPMLELLVERGANLNTRRTAINEAVCSSSNLAMVEWLIAHGARVNGWKGERHWPIHNLVNGRRYARKPETPAQDDTQITVLRTLLRAGADPDAPWDGGRTMLTWGDLRCAEVLLAHGADPNRRNAFGETALHGARSIARIRMLIAHGGDINALAVPEPPREDASLATPLQRLLPWPSQFYQDGRPRPVDFIPTLIELGADPTIRDGHGRNTLWYCTTEADFRLMQGYGLVPSERDKAGNTLLHHFTGLASQIAKPPYVDYVEFLLGIGFDINAVSAKGDTILHILGRLELAREEDIQFALDHGAGKTLRNAAGKRAYDVAPKSKTGIRRLLR
jgi:ankyrin repeat protein